VSDFPIVFWNDSHSFPLSLTKKLLISKAPIWPFASGVLVKPLDGVASAPPAEDRIVAPSNTNDVNLRCISNLLKVTSNLVSPDEECADKRSKV